MFRSGHLGDRLASGLLFLAFLLVPLAASTRFVDQFTSVKWYALEALAILWLVVERIACRSAGWPSFLRQTGPAWIAVAALVAVGSLRRGLGWALEPLVARACFTVLALCSFWRFRRAGLRLGPLRWGVTVAAAVVIGVGLLQFRGLRPLSALTAGDHFSATFGNVNMTAQFVGLALVILLSWRAGGHGSARVAGPLLELLIGAGLAYLFLLGTRSVGLALAGAVIGLIGIGRVSPWPLLRATAVAGLMLALVGPTRPVISPDGKQHSAERRLDVWADALRLIRDHPLGVGAGNFEQSFIPYALAGRSRPDESLVFRSPHNDYLRLVAEEGVVTTALLGASLVLVLVRLQRSPAIGAWRSPPGLLLGAFAVFLAVEAFFQFPFEMAFPALMAAVMLGLGWACLEEPGRPPSPSTAWSQVGWAVVAAALLGALGPLVAAEYLQVNFKGDARAQQWACRLDPRRLQACVDAAWLRIKGGDRRAGRSALVNVLECAPHFFPAIRVLGEDSLAHDDLQTGCHYLGLYRRLLQDRSSVPRRVVGRCPPEVRPALGDPVSSLHYAAFPLAPADAALRWPAGPCR